MRNNRKKWKHRLALLLSVLMILSTLSGFALSVSQDSSESPAITAQAEEKEKAEAEKKKEAEEAERKKKEAEAEKKKEAEAEKKKEAEEAERKKKETEEAERKKKEAEEAERKKKEAEEAEKEKQEKAEKEKESDKDAASDKEKESDKDVKDEEKSDADKEDAEAKDEEKSDADKEDAEAKDEEKSDADKEDKEEAEDKDKEESEEDKEDAEDEEKSEEEDAEDAEKEEEEEAEAEEPEEEEVKMPAQTFKGWANSVDVEIRAGPDTFPEGTQMRVTAASSKQVLEAAGDLFKNPDGATVRAVDITFYDADGKEIEPLKKVEVSLTSGMVAKAEDPMVLHLPDSGGVEKMGAHKGGRSMEFGSDSFSVYAIVEDGSENRLNVEFYEKDGSTLIASMLVKETDIDKDDVDFNKVVYDPGAGSMTGKNGEEYHFRGWTTDKNYTASTDTMTIAEVREHIKGMLRDGVANEEPLKLYAVALKDFYVVYQDEKGATIRRDDLAMARWDETSISYTVDMDYTPQEQDEKYDGWEVVEGPNENTVYQNGTELQLSESITLRAKMLKGFWLTFHENGKGATYTAPQFVERGQVPTRPTNPERHGYTFGGWYENPEGTGQAYGFDETLTEPQHVYAKWTTNQRANYTVIVWQQKVSGDGYDFVTSIPLTGNTGATINTVTQQGTGNNAYARINGTNYQYTGFHLKEFDQGVTIAPEDNTIVNVYYDRNEYTLTFQIPRGFGWTTIKTITALYEQNISNNFPIVGTNGVTYNNGERWDPQSNTPFNQVLVYIDVMPAANVTFHLNEANRPLKTINYYVEALPEDSDTVTAPNTLFIGNNNQQVSSGGRRFVLYNSISARYNGVTPAEDFIDLVGFTKLGADQRGQTVNGVFYYIYNTTQNQTINFYYTRDEYKILYMDGVYVTGDNLLQEETNRGKIGESDPIDYGADISSYDKGGANYYVPDAPDGNDYVFEGWYLDDACTHRYEFDTMPQGGVELYAKWVKKQYRVFLHPNAKIDGTNDPTLEWAPNQEMSFRVDYGEQINDGNPLIGHRRDYEIIGWYTDEACTKSFNMSAYVLNDSITTPYSQTEDTELNEYGEPRESGNKDAQANRFWIERKLDLYAKWRKILDGAEGIYLKYDETEEGVAGSAPTDNHFYSDQADAIAGAASKAKDDTMMFSHWVLLDKNGNETDVTYLPGDTFTVDADYAVERDLTPEEQEQHEGVTKEYTVTLKAVYVKKDDPLLTELTFDANGGKFGNGEEQKKHEGLKYNEGVDVPTDVTRDHYVLKGWSFDSGDNQTIDFPLTVTKLYADNLTRDNRNTVANIVYAVWEKLPTRKITVEKTVTGNMADTSKEFGFKAEGYDTDTAPTGRTVADDGTFTLSNDKSVVFTVYTDQTFKVEETDSDGYTTSYKIGSGTYTDGSSYSVDPGEEAITITFKNEKDIPPPGGVNRDVAPFLIMLGIGAPAAIGLYVWRQRRWSD